MSTKLEPLDGDTEPIVQMLRQVTARFVRHHGPCLAAQRDASGAPLATCVNATADGTEPA